MKNIFIIGLVVVAIGYMVVVMTNKYKSIKATNTQIEQQKSK